MLRTLLDARTRLAMAVALAAQASRPDPPRLAADVAALARPARIGEDPVMDSVAVHHS